MNQNPFWADYGYTRDGKHYTNAGVLIGECPADYELAYSAYLVLPRLAIQELPIDWQQKLFALLREAYEVHGMSTPEYTVRRRDKLGRFVPDPWAKYRHGSVKEAMEQDAVSP